MLAVQLHARGHSNGQSHSDPGQTWHPWRVIFFYAVTCMSTSTGTAQGGMHTCASHHSHKVKPHRSYATYHHHSIADRHYRWKWLVSEVLQVISEKEVWLWYTLTVIQHCVGDTIMMNAFKWPLQLGSTVEHTTGTGMRVCFCMLTCKESGNLLKSLSPKNTSSFGQYFRRLATLNSNYIHGVIQHLALFTVDQASLL